MINPEDNKPDSQRRWGADLSNPRNVEAQQGFKEGRLSTVLLKKGDQITFDLPDARLIFEVQQPAQPSVLEGGVNSPLQRALVRVAKLELKGTNPFAQLDFILNQELELVHTKFGGMTSPNTLFAGLPLALYERTQNKLYTIDATQTMKVVRDGQELSFARIQEQAFVDESELSSLHQIRQTIATLQRNIDARFPGKSKHGLTLNANTPLGEEISIYSDENKIASLSYFDPRQHMSYVINRPQQLFSGDQTYSLSVCTGVDEITSFARSSGERFFGWNFSTNKLFQGTSYYRDSDPKGRLRVHQTTTFLEFNSEGRLLNREFLAAPDVKVEIVKLPNKHDPDKNPIDFVELTFYDTPSSYRTERFPLQPETIINSLCQKFLAVADNLSP